MKQMIVKANDAGQRLDRFLQKSFESLPTSMMYKQIRKKNIKVNKKRCAPEQMLCEGDIIELYLNDDLLREKQRHYDFLKAPTDIDILYEDENVILLNKKQGLLCHPDGGEYVNTLVAALKRYLYEKGEWSPEEENAFTPALANRIDRNTGGIVIGAKSYEALKILNEKIRSREIDKFYLTIALGHFDKQSDTLTGYLIKDARRNMVTVSDTETPGAKRAVTRYTVLEEKDGASLLEVELLTGRTHQIRAQLAHSGHPLAGDGKYGDKHGRFRQELYAYKIAFRFRSDAGILQYLNGREFEVADCPVKERFHEG